MKSFVIATVLLSLASSQANAGFFDFLFGGDKAASEQPAAKPAAQPSEELLLTVAEQLGVNQNQAKGGMGALMQLAKSYLKPEQFAQLETSMPGMKGLLSAAPEISKGGKAEGVNSLLSNLGGLGKDAANLNTLNSQFESLGLDTKMISEYSSIAVDYFKGKGGDTGKLMEQGLGLLSKLN